MSAIDNILKSAAQNPATTPMNAPEHFFDAIGLMRGEYAPVGRAAVSFGLVSALVWAVRPSLMFTSDGSPKPYGAKGTSFPWYVLPTVAAVIGGVFI